jgi:hypothetical protein
LRLWLKRIVQLRDELAKSEKRLDGMMAPGRDLGGPTVNASVRTLADMKDVLMEFHRREIQIKDLDRGLVDFPALMDGREVFLCWEEGEEEVGFWHELDAGYQGREAL